MTALVAPEMKAPAHLLLLAATLRQASPAPVSRDVFFSSPSQKYDVSLINNWYLIICISTFISTNRYWKIYIWCVHTSPSNISTNDWKEMITWGNLDVTDINYSTFLLCLFDLCQLLIKCNIPGSLCLTTLTCWETNYFLGWLVPRTQRWGQATLLLILLLQHVHNVPDSGSWGGRQWKQ